jgi:Cyclic nucleotide-binding domain/Major Facilitator Superfamily
MALRASLGVLVAVLRNRRIAAIEAAYLGFALAEWVEWIGMLVYAFNVGGATGVGIAVVVQLAPAAVLAPVAAVLGDRYRRDRMLVIAYVLQGASMLALAVAIGTGLPVVPVYILAALANAAMTLTRPLQAAIIPALADTPAELTAANVTAGIIENGSMLVGPALAGLGLAIGGIAAVFAVFGALVLASAALVALAVETTSLPMVVGDGRGHPVAALLEGFGVLLRPGRPRPVAGVFVLSEMVWGALDVLVVILVFDLLALDDSAVGYLGAVIGAGGLLGVALTVALIGRPRLAVPYGLGAIVFGLPLAFLAVSGGLVVAVPLLLVAGAGRSVMDVAGRTLLQRVAPHAMLARIFGVLEGLDMASLAVGSMGASLAVAVLGPRGAFLIIGLLLPVAVLLASRSLREIDMASEVHLVELELLRGIPIFAPLSALVLERLAASLVPAHAEAGDAIITQGEPGDRYYVVAEGRVRVLVDGRPVRELGSGEGFGEIALLRDVPRTASVEAVTEVELLALERAPFLEVVTGYPQSSAAADTVIAGHLSPAD